MRTLDTATLDLAAKDYAAGFLRPDKPHRRIEGRFIDGPSWVMENFYRFTMKDEFEYLLDGIRSRMGPATLVEFEALAAAKFTPRSDETLVKELREHYAVDIDGNHISGVIGKVRYGNREVGKKLVEVETELSIRTRNMRRVLGKNLGQRQTKQMITTDYWPTYAGELEERYAEEQAGMESGEGGVVDALPDSSVPLTILPTTQAAFATRISLNFAIAMVDAGLLLLDEGTVGAVLDGRTTPRPANVDDAVTGTALFLLNSDDAVTFAGAVDAAPGAIATAGTIDPETSAIATGTLLYVRASSANSVDTPLNDHLEGVAGTGGGNDFDFNTLAIVIGATVDLTSWTVTQPES